MDYILSLALFKTAKQSNEKVKLNKNVHYLACSLTIKIWNFINKIGAQIRMIYDLENIRLRCAII